MENRQLQKKIEFNKENCKASDLYQRTKPYKDEADEAETAEMKKEQRNK